MTKLGLVVTMFMATAVSNNAMAQKFEFKSTKVEHYEYRTGKDFGNENTYEIENNFILDFDNKKWWNERDKTIIEITSDVREDTLREGEKLYMFNFIINDMEFFGSLEMYDDKKKDDVLEYQYDYFPEGSEYPATGIKLTYTGKTTELKK